MTEDEAFIRAIVAAPGDEAPRLVYADWLDERGDRRAAFLRQEAEVFRGPREGPAFRAGVRDLQLARRALDPVWAFRVSRPPVGVCSDVIRFDTEGTDPGGPPLVSEDLQAYEEKHRVTLPAAYRAFLLNRNGGFPYPYEFVFPDARRGEYRAGLNTFIAIAPRGEMPANQPEADSMFGVYSDPDLGIDRYLVIADEGEGGRVLLTTVGPDAGRVIYVDDSTNAMYADSFRPAADSLPAFLAMIFTTDPEWGQYIARNDLARLRAWLDAGGDPNAVHPLNRDTPLGYAINWRRVVMVRELLARGARPTRNFRYYPGYQQNPEVARLIDAALRERRP